MFHLTWSYHLVLMVSVFLLSLSPFGMRMCVMHINNLRKCVKVLFASFFCVSTNTTNSRTTTMIWQSGMLVLAHTQTCIHIHTNSDTCLLEIQRQQLNVQRSFTSLFFFFFIQSRSSSCAARLKFWFVFVCLRSLDHNPIDSDLCDSRFLLRILVHANIYIYIWLMRFYSIRLN